MRTSLSQFIPFEFSAEAPNLRGMARADAVHTVPSLWINRLDTVGETFYSAPDRVFRY